MLNHNTGTCSTNTSKKKITGSQIVYKQGSFGVPYYQSITLHYDVLTSELQGIITDFITPGKIIFNQNAIVLHINDTSS
ncbi:unnamed protein product [Adineta steineri]|uniref:Uncharacterized protein n=1 Tax=Adineta steineri TaxID=433720 RepID=A0A813N6D3_9BILA|nr:unnamed protein product [Adineta steineri]CAF0989793.1 unnamed protein product [Adineta steineri]